ncbi:MAG: SGNH/GDSL hydrolase family protein [Polynucleobacter sp.]|uniref:SGNH/GDSL hydrolase family protein n=1 Tax=Polynucleobacter sp. TaxID=2029855 RepID=UPI003015BA56
MTTTLLAGLTVLIIGDSHLASPNYLIKTLHDDLIDQGAAVHSIGICGSNPGDWIVASSAGKCGGAERLGKNAPTLLEQTTSTTPIKNLIAKDKPNLVLVVMGDTMANYKRSFAKAWAWQEVTGLTNEISRSGTACAWVGPAWGTEGGKYGKTYARAQQMSTFLATNVAPCTYIDSLSMSKPGAWATVDGQHFTVSGYQAWGNAITQSIIDLPNIKQIRK